MIAYASRTGTKRNLAALREAGWRLMVSAKGVLRTEGFQYALDNGAWTAFVNKHPFDEQAFLAAYSKLAANADFVVLPDIVAGGLNSLEFSMKWTHLDKCPNYLAIQDGIEPQDVIIDNIKGLFLGGTTEWKEASMMKWGCFARAKSLKYHIGRVNSARRISLCHAAGADSFDGSSVSRYAITLPKLENARQQRALI